MRSRSILTFLLILGLLLPAEAKASKRHVPGKTSQSSASTAKRKAVARKRALTQAEVARNRRLKRAFVASTDLKPMARQLLETRSSAAYKGVEAYAKKHAGSDAGALAYLLLGYAHSSEKRPEWDKAITALKAAKSHAGDLSDYVDYLLATAYRSRPADVILVLDGFAQRYPGSLFRRDAAMLQANALLATRAYAEAASLLEANRQPVRADIELVLGAAYEGQGERSKAIAAYRNLYYGMPMSGSADEAGARLKLLIADGEYGSTEQRRLRAEALAKGKWYDQAIAEYRQLIVESSGPVPGLQIALASILTRAGRNADAKTLLTQMDATVADTELKAQRFYLLAELARNSEDDAAQLGFVQELDAVAPASRWMQEALMSMGNKFLLRREYAQAELYYRQIADRFPQGRGPTAHWKAVWLSFRQGKTEEARKGFEEQLGKYPQSAEVPNALYWRGRIAEEDGQPAIARAYYLKLTDRFRNYYYTQLARERLKAMGTGPAAEVALLAKVPPADLTIPSASPTAEITDPRFQKARLLANAALYDFAIKELQAAAAEAQNAWVTAAIVRLHDEAGKPSLALQLLKRTIPSYFAVDVNALPRQFAEGLFPRPYWSDLARDAAANGLDPYLVASLIRQESEFNPLAISHANAYGLMQLLPEVGKRVAKEVKLRPYSTAELLNPTANLKLGTRYFRHMIDENGGRIEYALAAYNAGSNRVNDWLANGRYRDTAEFVESIPFTETREYVQAIMRNVNVYKQLYERGAAR